MKITYIYYGNHYLYDSWTKSLNIIGYSFVPKFIFDVTKRGRKKGFIFNLLMRSSVILQLLSLLKSPAIPKADVYLVENMACMLPAIIRKKKSSKIIVFNGDQFFIDYQKAKGIRKKYSDFLIKRVDGMIAISDLYKDIAKKYVKVPQEMVYPYVDVKKYAAKRCDIKSKNICFTGYIVMLKAIDLLVEAFLKLDKKYKEKLYLVGAEVDKIPILEKNKENKDIIVTGWAEYPTVYMKKCGLYINPARKEAFGINILEAMCMEMPVIVSDRCGAAEIVRKIDKRLIIKTEVDDIIKKVEWLNSNPKLKEDIGKRCRKEAIRYTKERSVEGFKKALKKLLKETK